MPASLAPITPELLKDLQAGKESALEQLFRPNFDALVAEAAERLEDVPGAQKVVASAYLELWANKTDAQAPSQLEALLRQLVSSGVAHELRRRAAAHRMADTDGDHKNRAAARHAVPAQTVDEVWARITTELRTVKKDARERARELAEHKRHEAAAHLAQVSKGGGVSKIAVISAIVLAALVAIPLWIANKGAETTKAGQALAREDAKPMKSSAGQRGTVKLEDNTEVHIGSATEVKMTAHFPKDFRALQVTGAASITAPSAKDQLLVKVGNAWIHAAGATIAVRSFADDSGQAMIRATSGTVKLTSSKEEKDLTAPAAVLVGKDGTMSDLPAAQATMAFSWIDGSFATKDMPLTNVLNELRKWYGLEILPRDSTILQRPITMTASLESSKDAIAALEAAGNVKIGFEGLAMIITDMPAAPAGKKGKK